MLACMRPKKRIRTYIHIFLAHLTGKYLVDPANRRHKNYPTMVNCC